PAAWRLGLAAVVRELLGRAGLAGREVGSVGLASQVDGVVPTDDGLRPLRDAVIWLDRRATRQAEALARRVGEQELFEITGLNCDASHTAPKIMWLAEPEPALYRSARWLLPVGSYLVAWLTGAVVVDPANASSTLVYDVAKGGWSELLLDAAGIDGALLPEIRPATDVAGGLTVEAAGLLGLRPGCPVVVGTGDDHSAALAAGLLRPGLVVDVTGTAEPVGAVAAELTLDPERLVETHAHAVAGALLVENPGFVSGGSTLWLAESVLRCRQADLLALAATAPAGSDGVLFLPALSGATAPRWNDRMRGAFAGLGMNHGGAELARAVLEGCAYALRDIVDRLAALGLAGGPAHGAAHDPARASAHNPARGAAHDPTHDPAHASAHNPAGGAAHDPAGGSGRHPAGGSARDPARDPAGDQAGRPTGDPAGARPGDEAGDEVRVVGGGARSPLWLQIKADVLNRPVRSVLAQEPTAVGAAMLAGVSAGMFADLDDAVARTVAIAPEPVRPDQARADRYAECYANYRRLYDGVERSTG
ncbi:MAG: xylulokinase, partial [Mycobacteriales bacterium]